MPKSKKGIYRVVDANVNRAKEGLRVCEDVCRFILEDAIHTKRLKKIRHDLTGIVVRMNVPEMIQARDIEQDIGRQTIVEELKRKDIPGLLYANLQRVKESVRVLEEFAKLIDQETSKEFKKLRYRVYAVEKKIAQKC